MNRFALELRILSMLLPVIASGCGTTMFSNRTANPVLQDFAVRLWGQGSTLSTTASRRLALMVYSTDEHNKEVLLTCAEPPPDVGETFAKAVAAQIEANAQDPKITASASGSFNSQIATAVAPLLVRSQGLQVLRDSAYTLCVDRMNGWLNAQDYIRMKDERFDKAMQLIEKELPYLSAMRSNSLGAPPIPQAASSPGSSPSP